MIQIWILVHLYPLLWLYNNTTCVYVCVVGCVCMCPWQYALFTQVFNIYAKHAACAVFPKNKSVSWRLAVTCNHHLTEDSHVNIKVHWILACFRYLILRHEFKTLLHSLCFSLQILSDMVKKETKNRWPDLLRVGCMVKIFSLALLC